MGAAQAPTEILREDQRSWQAEVEIKSSHSFKNPTCFKTIQRAWLSFLLRGHRANHGTTREDLTHAEWHKTSFNSSALLTYLSNSLRQRSVRRAMQVGMHIRTHAQLSACRGLFCRAASLSRQSQPVLVPRARPPQGRAWHLSSLNFMEFLLIHSPGLPRKSNPAQGFIICRFDMGASHCLLQATDEDVEQDTHASNKQSCRGL